MHVHVIEDARGDLVDVVPLCSDQCHRYWCERSGAEYGGWYGAQEWDPEEAAWCASCGRPVSEAAWAEAEETLAPAPAVLPVFPPFPGCN